jgi:thymidylate synthase
MATLIISEPTSKDATIERYANPERLQWMHANFVDTALVPELGNADSYATRLHDYSHSRRDQLMWVGERLRADPLSRSATITTLQPLTDTSYIPCVSMLDFFLHDGALHLVVYAHSIDFGAKGYGNLVELASILEGVADDLDAPRGTLTMIVKSAHVYDTDVDYMSAVLFENPPKPGAEV